MERVKDQPSRGPLGTLGSMLAGGGQALIVQAQSLADDVQRRIADVMPPVWRVELDSLAHRIVRLENVLAEGGREIVGPVRALALNAIEGTAALRARIDHVVERLERVERLLGDLQTRAANPSAEVPWTSSRSRS